MTTLLETHFGLTPGSGALLGSKIMWPGAKCSMSVRI